MRTEGGDTGSTDDYTSRGNPARTGFGGGKKDQHVVPHGDKEIPEAQARRAEDGDNENIDDCLSRGMPARAGFVGSRRKQQAQEEPNVYSDGSLKENTSSLWQAGGAGGGGGQSG